MSTSTATLAGWQVRYEQRSFWRNRRAAFFSLLFLVAAIRAAAFFQFDYQLAPSRGPPSFPASSVR